MVFKEHPKARNGNVNTSMQITLVCGDKWKLGLTHSSRVGYYPYLKVRLRTFTFPLCHCHVYCAFLCIRYRHCEIRR